MRATRTLSRSTEKLAGRIQFRGRGTLRQASIERCEHRGVTAESHVRSVGEIEAGVERIGRNQNSIAIFDRDMLDADQCAHDRFKGCRVVRS